MLVRPLAVRVELADLADSRRRLPAIVLSILSGALLSWALLPVIGPGLTTALLALPLVAPVAAAKTATACGMNVLASLPDFNRPTTWRLAIVLAYGGTVALTSMAVGFVISQAGGAIGFSRLLPALIPICIYLGLWDLGIVRRRPPLASSWQVPQRWVRNPVGRPLVWGVFLGSGLATQMPYPSFYGLLLLVATLPTPYGVVLMGGYGIFRALPAIPASLFQRFAGTADLRLLVALRLLGHSMSGLGCLLLAGGLAMLLTR